MQPDAERRVPVGDRDALLAEYGLSELAGEPDLQALADLATQICAVPNAVVNLISERWQHQIGAVGFTPSICSREDSMCAVSMVEPGLVAVPDARRDPRFARSPFVTGDVANVRFYAASQLRAPSGQVLGTLCVFDDVVRGLTDQQARGLTQLAHQVVDVLELRRRTRLLTAAVDELTRARAELLRSNAELTAFAGQVSHDLRNPLAGLAGFLELLADHPAVRDDPTASNHVKRALASSGRMHELVDELLAYARLGGGLRRVPVDLRALLADMGQDFAATGLAEGLESDVGPLPTVLADPVQVRALMQNLLVNTVRFRRPDRTPMLRIRAEREGDLWRIEVADNGVGVPPDRREDAFTLLTQVHELGAVPGGNGIGLATCRRIVNAHGGSIGITDGIDGGAAVWFTLPDGGEALNGALNGAAGPAGRS
ncbi:sensor histidine kinase [Pseudonocardia bannensis]|uniref:Sensor-like histidine kinase SenX3 n=1 Tax=Pseudonocardia bannensis TaxID=630973 RepID=A0A848DB39_9PSEU|nr:ATP-binding protein [Pseudonocardia bannensis]NMH90264.1 histidine kinase [Pseudonocardia bannensis]